MSFASIFADGGREFSAKQNRTARLRARQIQAVVRFTPIAIVVNLVNAILVAYVAIPVGGPVLVTAWAFGIALVMFLGFMAWLARRNLPPRETASPRALRHAATQGAILGALWGVAPVLWFPSSDPAAQLVIGTVSTGMICAGGFALATVERAAAGYVAALTLGTLLSLLASSNPYAQVLTILLAAYAAVVLGCVHSTAKLFKRQVLGAIDLPELITHTRQDYAALALDLATNPARLAEIRRKLDANRLTTPLFDTERFARHIEAAYDAAYQRYLDGKPPGDITIPT